ncbi:MAG: hypothetical protein RIM23_06410 [Coleofasciculus sp. G3-WIS-01]|uniref:hypothetical protein n=1 Tax=Coleofasciculus sp. G3-WIS-01 TaxID=3069528 RepID=UPI0032F4AC9D
MGSRKDITRGSPDLCRSFLSFPGGAIASIEWVAENILDHTPKQAIALHSS